jgi:hypothetical protein
MCFPLISYVYVIRYVDVDSVYQVHIIGYVPYVGFATYHRATVMIHLCLYKKTK